ncbi:glycosyl transferase family 1 [Tamlana nanhaiensis]|uniref:Glycosyl transferase family 1 n=2 Tax=Neotamlana nanhaiensis TaxID=1382798 RepID=A0A0D7W683_9FLAO|nr:glycosyl transferase family 1 [Tamlana nanhaiensis]
MKIIISHPTSNQNNRAAVKGLYSAGILENFHTTLATFPGGFFDNLSKFNAFKDFSRRRFDIELKPYTKTHNIGEAGRILASKFGVNSLISKKTGVFSIDNMYTNLDKRVAQQIKEKCVDAIYAYEDGAFYSFNQAKKCNVKCLYDLPIGYWKYAIKLLQDQISIWPEWAPTLTGFSDSQEKLSRKDAELAMADRIFVASSFTAESLKEYDGNLAPVEVIPYGFPKAISTRSYSIKNRPLKLLFVGGLSQRKGIANMFAAVEKLGNNVELTVVGGKISDDCKPLNNALTKHNYIPSLPHDKVLELMRHNDVLLFPSLFEGFGLVITEAMSQGTPVITTNRTAGPDLIKHNVNGWLIDAGSTQALQECLENLIKNPKQVADAGKAALETAKKRPWSVYGDELAAAILRSDNSKNDL